MAEASDGHLLPALAGLGFHGEKAKAAGLQPLRYAGKGWSKISEIHHGVRSKNEIVIAAWFAEEIFQVAENQLVINAACARRLDHPRR